MPLGSIPEPVAWIAGVATAVAAVAAAVKKALVPVMQGLRELIRNGHEVVEGARVAKEQLSPNGGASLKDQVTSLEEVALQARDEAREAHEQAAAARSAIGDHEDRMHPGGE